jgi:hypothetical protein
VEGGSTSQEELQDDRHMCLVMMKIQIRQFTPHATKGMEGQ